MKIYKTLMFIVILIWFGFACFVYNDLPQDPPKKKLAQDTMKMDTVPLHKQRAIYKKQMIEQMDNLDSLLIKKKKK